MKLKLKDTVDNLQVASSSDLYYDVMVGGYIKPKNYLDVESAKAVQDAIDLVNHYLSMLEEVGLLEEI